MSEITSETHKTKNGRYFQLAFVFFATIGLPLISWYYLRLGIDYRKVKLAEMKAIGALPALHITDLAGDTAISKRIHKKIIILADLKKMQGEPLKNVLNTIGRIHKQFDDRKDMLFVLSLPADILPDALIAYKLKDEQQVFLVKDADITTILAPFNVQKFDNAIYLVDAFQQVRRAYNATYEADLKNLVEHAAMLIPMIKEDDPTLIRTKEK
jgi:hypothetical protein